MITNEEEARARQQRWEFAQRCRQNVLRGHGFMPTRKDITNIIATNGIVPHPGTVSRLFRGRRPLTPTQFYNLLPSRPVVV